MNLANLKINQNVFSDVDNNSASKQSKYNDNDNFNDNDNDNEIILFI